MLAAMIAPRKYVQGRGALRQAGELIRPLGDRVLLIVDQRTWPAAGQELANQLAQAGIAVTRADFAGECSEREIARLSEIGRQDTVTVVAGVGGGKILDTAKAVAFHLNAACVSVPTVASTDAPTSALSVIYTDEGVFHR
jgi:glycerol dehydrogenase